MHECNVITGTALISVMHKRETMKKKNLKKKKYKRQVSVTNRIRSKSLFKLLRMRNIFIISAIIRHF